MIEIIGCVMFVVFMILFTIVAAGVAKEMRRN